MNWFDIVILVLIIASAFNGMSKGLIRQALSLAGLIGGILLAGQHYEEFSANLTFITNPAAANVMAFVLIFVGALIAAYIIGSVLQRVTKILMFGWFDQFAGLVFGAVQAVIIIQLVLLLLLRFPIAGQMEFLSESSIGVILMAYTPLLLTILPTEFSDLLRLVPA